MSNIYATPGSAVALTIYTQSFSTCAPPMGGYVVPYPGPTSPQYSWPMKITGSAGPASLQATVFVPSNAPVGSGWFVFALLPTTSGPYPCELYNSTDLLEIVAGSPTVPPIGPPIDCPDCPCGDGSGGGGDGPRPI